MAIAIPVSVCVLVTIPDGSVIDGQEFEILESIRNQVISGLSFKSIDPAPMVPITVETIVDLPVPMGFSPVLYLKPSNDSENGEMWRDLMGALAITISEYYRYGEEGGH